MIKPVNLTEIDLEAGKSWLEPLTAEELEIRLEQIRRKNREKYLAELDHKRSK